MSIPATDKANVQNPINENVQAGSTLHTDDHKSYSGLDGLLYKHESTYVRRDNQLETSASIRMRRGKPASRNGGRA